MKIGTAKYGGGKKTFKIKDGDNVFGILPPLGKLAAKGKWSQYYKIEWGYKDSSDKFRPFQDVRVVNPKTKMVEVESAAHLKREELIRQKNSLIELMKQGKATKHQVQEATDLVKRYNLDCKHYLNVITLDGEIGLLKIGHRAKLSLDAAINSLRSKGVEPIGLTGVYFNINRVVPMGKPLDTTYTITPYMENIQANVNGQIQIIQQRKSYELNDVIISRIANEAFELSGMYPTPTAEQVYEIVNGTTADIDRILGKKNDFSSHDEEEIVEETVDTTQLYKAPTAAPAVAPAVAPTPQATVVEQTPVTAPSAVQTPVATSTTQAETTESALTDEEWLRSIGAL